MGGDAAESGGYSERAEFGAVRWIFFKCDEVGGAHDVGEDGRDGAGCDVGENMG